MGKLIFLDIDGTLAMPGKPVGQNTLRAIAKARENGHKVFLCTGRPACIVPREIAAVPTDGGIYVAGGRAVVDGKLVYDHPLRQDLLEEIEETFQQLGVYYEYECDSHVYMSSIPIKEDETNPLEGGFAMAFGQNVDLGVMVPMAEHKEDETIYKIPYVTSPASRQEEIQAALTKEARNVVFGGLFDNSPYTVGEVNDIHNSKADAMLAICEALGVRPEDCIAFGDSMNDMEIVKAAGIGVAMGNADEALKAAADRICESCEEEGVAWEFERLGLS